MGASHSKVVGKLRYAIPLSSFYQLFIVNDGVVIDFYKLEIVRCVLCHYAIMNVNVHNLVRGKNIKGFVNYNKDHNISSLKTICLKIAFNTIYKLKVNNLPLHKLGIFW